MRVVPDDQLGLFLKAADRWYSPIRLSHLGAVTLAISFGRPVIAPDRGALRDHVPPMAGDSLDPEQPDGLGEALMRNTGASLW